MSMHHAAKKLNGSVNITRIILHENQSYQSGKTPIAQRKRKRERERDRNTKNKLRNLIQANISPAVVYLSAV